MEAGAEGSWGGLSYGGVIEDGPAPEELPEFGFHSAGNIMPSRVLSREINEKCVFENTHQLKNTENESDRKESSNC